MRWFPRRLLHAPRAPAAGSGDLGPRDAAGTLSSVDVDDIQLLSVVMDGAGEVIAGVTGDQWERPTPCPDYTVRTLVEHMVGWAHAFEAAARGRRFEGDPGAYRRSTDTADTFRALAASLVEGWRSAGTDRTVTLTGPALPGAVVLNMTVTEYAAHAWDLAVASGQTVPLADEEAEETLARARVTLPPEFRGEGKAFADIVEVGDDAPALDRLVAFLGRPPQWSAAR